LIKARHQHMSPRPQPPSRRRFLAGAGIAAACWSLPALSRAETGADGLLVLRARSAPPLWGYNGTVPGPTLRAKRGDELRVRLVNELAEPTTIHWHGLRLPNAMDGVPQLTQPAVAPGASFDCRFRPPDAGTFWYHAFIPGQVDKGLHGALIVEEAEPIEVDRDVVLLLGMPGAADGASAPVLVNGALRPDIPVKTGERLRLRLINATAARGLVLKLDGHAARVMALDGQPAEPFVARDSRVWLGPGGRADLFIDATHDGGKVTPILAGVRDEQPIAQLAYASGGAARATPRAEPRPLPPNPLPARIDLRGSLKVEMALANSKQLDAVGPPLFTVKRGRAVTLAVRNASGQPQALHVHGHSFRLLDRLDDGWKPYWLDTLVVGEQVERIAFVADNPGKWLIDCRALERSDAGTSVWFAVT
jgi:FtsP/CotA-like multicopper oxidase with cupredoxin domain